MYETTATRSNGHRRQSPSQLNPIRTVDLAMSRRNDDAPKTNHHTDDDIFYEGPTAWKYLVRNWPHNISGPFGVYATLLLGWALAYTVYPDELAPDGVLARMGLLFAGGQLCGYAVQLVGVPDMLGMIGWGMLCANVGLADFTGYAGLEASLREMAMVNIMLLAGLGLDIVALRQLAGMVLRLAIVPAIAETVVVTMLAHWLLDMPWLWGLLLGLVITPVSPNVVVTVLLRLREERLGLNKGIHTVIIASTSIDDVLAIFLFGIVLGMLFVTGSLTDQLLQGPVGIGIGVVYGFLFGVMLWFIPSNRAQYSNGVRFAMLSLGGMFSVLASKFIGYPSAGALGSLTLAFVAGIGWRRRAAKVLLQRDAAGNATSTEYNDVAVKMDLLWKFLKPISFALIGKEVDFAKLDGTVVAYGTIVLIVGIAFRSLVAYGSAYGGDLNWKERAYVTLSGLPKATVQAALGPIALDLARKLNSSEHMRLASSVLVVSVLAIVLTAPLGAVLMIRLAPFWLQRSANETPPTDGEDDASDDETLHV